MIANMKEQAPHQAEAAIMGVQPAAVKQPLPQLNV